MFDKSENIEEFEEEFDGESYHSFTESIHDFSQIVTSNIRDTKNYLAVKESNVNKNVLKIKENKQILLNSEDNNSNNENRIITKSISSNIKSKLVLSKNEFEESKIIPINE